MARLRSLLAPALVAALVAPLIACAPALDFDALSSGKGGNDADARPSPDAAVDSPIDAAGDSPGDSSADAVEEYAADPCFDVTASGSGLYCGRSTQNGFSGGNPDILYTCSPGTVTATTMCPNGCFLAPVNYEDECDDCGGKADGLYCGSQFGYMTPSNRLLIPCASGHVNEGSLMPCATSCLLDGGAHCGP